MAFGHRLNAEDVFFRLAEDSFAEAVEQKDTISHSNTDGDKDLSFEGFPTPDGLAHASVAIIGWATCVESYVNLVWNQLWSDAFPSSSISAFVRRQFRTLDKAKEILRHYNEDVGSLTWWPDLKDLFGTRNSLIHYSEAVAYQGFGYAAPMELRLSYDNCRKRRQAAVQLIETLSSHSNLRKDFLYGNYEIVHIDA